MAVQNEQFEMIMMETMERADKTVSVLNGEYIVIRAGRANPHILDKVLVDYYGTPSPINQVGNISVVEGRCLVIAPWDASMLKVIEKQLLAENLGITPINDGKVIRLTFPALTEERRKELVKQIKKMAEDSKVAIRNIRRDAMDALKNMKNNKELSEDEHALCEKDVDKVKTSKTVAKDEVRDYYGAIDHSLYSEEAEETISGYMAEVLTAIDNATTHEQIDTAIAEFKGKVEKVEKLKPAGNGSDKKGSGCGGSIGSFGLTAILGLAGVVSLIRRKKEER